MPAIVGQMMERPLLISSIIDYAALVHADRQIVSRGAAGRTHRYGYGDAAKRIARLAHGLIAGLHRTMRFAMPRFTSHAGQIAPAQSGVKAMAAGGGGPSGQS